MRKRQLASSRSDILPACSFARTDGPMSTRMMLLWPPAHTPAPTVNEMRSLLAMFFNACNWASANPPPDLPVTNPACPYPSSAKPRGNGVLSCPPETNAAMVPAPLTKVINLDTLLRQCNCCIFRLCLPSFGRVAISNCDDWNRTTAHQNFCVAGVFVE